MAPTRRHQGASVTAWVSHRVAVSLCLVVAVAVACTGNTPSPGTERPGDTNAMPPASPVLGADGVSSDVPLPVSASGQIAGTGGATAPSPGPSAAVSPVPSTAPEPGSVPIVRFRTTLGSPAMSFTAISWSLTALPAGRRFYALSDPVALTPPAPVDRHGVVLFERDSKRYYHPVAIAQQALAYLESYRINEDPRYLERARTYADQLAAIGTRARGALYFPYRFSFTLAGNRRDVMKPPWYSAMAEGQALSLMVRLFELTGEQRYRTLADSIFTSFLRPRASGVPWTVFVDGDGYLWLEEYPKSPPMRVLNGHLFALFGLYDYYLLTGSNDARELIQGAAATVRHYGRSFEVPGQISYYSLRVHVQNAKYHGIHIKQLRELAAITGDRWFANLAAELARDHAPG